MFAQVLFRIVLLNSFQVQARIYTTQMDKFTGEAAHAACLSCPIASRNCSSLAPATGDNSINQAWDEVFADVVPAIFGSLQNNHLLLLTPQQVPPPARTSIGVKELPLGRWIPAHDCTFC
jgi:hypothetical protein